MMISSSGLASARGWSVARVATREAHAGCGRARVYVELTWVPDLQLWLRR